MRWRRFISIRSIAASVAGTAERVGSVPISELVLCTFAVILLIAAGLKLQAAVATRSLMGWSHTGREAEIAIEIGIAAWLLSGIAREWARRTSIVLLTIFLCVAAFRLFAGDQDCGCFGPLKFNPLWTTLFDLAGIGAVYLFGSQPPAAVGRTPGSGKLFPACGRIVVAAYLSASIPAAVTFAVGGGEQTTLSGGRTVVLDADSWTGKRCPLLDFVEGPTRAGVSVGAATLVVVDRDCHKCQAYLSRLRSDKRQVVYVADIARGVDPGSSPVIDSRFSRLALRADVSFAMEVPVELALANGIVVRVSHPRE